MCDSVIFADLNYIERASMLEYLDTSPSHRFGAEFEYIRSMNTSCSLISIKVAVLD